MWLQHHALKSHFTITIWLTASGPDCVKT